MESSMSTISCTLFRLRLLDISNTVENTNTLNISEWMALQVVYYEIEKSIAAIHLLISNQ